MRTEPICTQCASAQVREWDEPPAQSRRQWERDREFWTNDEGKWCKVHCTYLRRAVEYPLEYSYCPWFETVEEAAERARMERRKGG